MARFGKGTSATADGTIDGAAKPARATKAPRPASATRSRPSGGTFVGLDIGTQMIKAVELRGSGPGLTITALAIGPTPPDILLGGIVADPKALGMAIKSLLSKNGIRASRTISAAAGADAVVVRVIEVPKMTPAELAETMKWEIERHIPFSANDVELSYQAIDDPATLAADTANPNMEVLLAVARRDMVALHLDTLQAAGLKPVAVDIEELAVGRSLIDLSKRGLADKNVVIVNIGATLTEVGIFKAGLLRFPRIIPLAGENITRAISDTLGISMADAEDEKRQNAVVLMDMLGRGNDSNPFEDSGFGDFGTPTPVPSVAAVAPPSFGGVAAPPVFGGIPVPESIAATDPEDPFATATTYNPFETSATAPGFDLGDVGTGSDPFGTANTPAVPAPEDPRSRRQREIFDAILPVLGEIAMEVRRSIDYFRSRYPNDTVDQIILCGGSAVLQKLDEYMQQEMGVPTVVANPFAGINVSSKQIGTDRLALLAPSFAVAVGLAARDAILGTG